MTSTADRAPRVAAWLALGGTLPFAAGALALWFAPGIDAALVRLGLSTYAAVVLSFLGGIQWGTGVAVQANAPQSARSLFLLSVVPPLLAWFMLFLGAAGARFMVAIFLFSFAWLIDALLHVQGLLPRWHFRLRSIATPVVLAALAAALAAG